MKESLFFIAIIPNQEICEEVRHFKLYAQKHFGSGHALRSPAHITLQAPFRWKQTHIKELDQTLTAFVKGQSGFYLELENFSAFVPRVIFVNIVENETLSKLQKSLTLTLKQQLGLTNDRPERAFHPHMTVAFKDLKKEQYPLAWQHFSQLEYKRLIKVGSIFLLKHEKRKWHIFREYFLARL